MSPRKVQSTPRRGRPVLLSGPLAALVDAAGGVAALASQLGVNPRTVQRWDGLEMPPSGPARVVLAALAAQHGLAAPFEVTQ